MANSYESIVLVILFPAEELEFATCAHSCACVLRNATVASDNVAFQRTPCACLFKIAVSMLSIDCAALFNMTGTEQKVGLQTKHQTS